MNIQLENTFVIAHAEQRDQLLYKIDEYLMGRGEPEGTGILEEVKKFLDNQRSIDNDNENIPKPIHDTLTEIQRSLAHIESAKTAITTTNSYSAAATRGQASEAPPIPRRTKPITSSKQTEPLPQEVRQAMTVVISSASDKEKIKNMPTKYLVETLQAETEGIRGVSRLISGDLKLHTESLRDFPVKRRTR